MNLKNIRKKDIISNFYCLYDRFSLSVSYLDKFEKLFEKYWDSYPKRLYRFVYVFYEVSKLARDSEYFTTNCTNILIAYAYVMRDELGFLTIWITL